MDQPAGATGGGGWEQRLPGPLARLLRWMIDHGVAGAALGAGLLVSLAGVVGLAAWLLSPGEAPEVKPPDNPCRIALAALDNQDFDICREIAWKLGDLSNLAPDDWGVPGFVLGVSAAKEAEQSTDPDVQRQQYVIAARYLTESRERGFPRGREAEGTWYLAQSLVGAGRPTPAVAALRAAYDANPPRRHELAAPLAAACLDATPPQLADALTWSDRHLANKLLSPEEREGGLIQRASILTALDRLEEARQALASVAAESKVRTDAQIAMARLHLRAAEREGDPAAAHAARLAAIKLLQEALTVLRPPLRSYHAASYLLGLAHWHDHDPKAAETQFARVRRTSGGEPEALPAALGEAEVAADRALDAATAEAYVAAFQMAAEIDPREYDNPWLSLAELEARAAAGYEKFFAANHYNLALQLAAAFPPVVPLWQQQHMSAAAQRGWAEKLLAEAEALKPAEAAPLREQAFRNYQAAGAAYLISARERIATRDYPEEMWQAAECFWLGRGYRQALSALTVFLENGAAERTADALVKLAEVQLSLGDTARCLQTVRRAITDHPQHPAVYRARLVAAQAAEFDGQLDDARTWLLENLEHEQLTPKSLEWRDALFALGRVLYQQGTLLDAGARVAAADQPSAAERVATAAQADRGHELLREATRRLAEAVERYPDAPQRPEAEYLLAEAHRLAARLPRERLATATVESTRHALADEMQRHLLAAVEHYAALQALLNERHNPPAAEQAMLRNCYFAQGGAWFDLGEYRKAIEAYSTATNLYQTDPAALEAYVQIAHCYRRLQRPFDARAMVEQAKTVLKNMPPDAKFDRTTRYSRDEWIRLLDWMAAL